MKTIELRLPRPSADPSSTWRSPGSPQSQGPHPGLPRSSAPLGLGLRQVPPALRESPEHPQIAPSASTDPRLLRGASVIPSPPPPPRGALATWLTRLPGGRQLEKPQATSAPARRKPAQPRPRRGPERPLPAASRTRSPTGCGFPDPTPPSRPDLQPAFPCVSQYRGPKL